MTNKYVPKLPALHKGQLEVANSEARWKILCAGRRFGKTRLGVQLCMEVALRGGRAWWVAPTFSIARVGWRDIAASAKSFPREIEPKSICILAKDTLGSISLGNDFALAAISRQPTLAIENVGATHQALPPRKATSIHN